MASETLLISVLMLSSVRLGKSADTLINLTCQSAVGVIGQTTNISCSYKSHTEPVIINTVVLYRFRENKSCFTFHENNVTGDSRFKVESLSSLQLHNTAISDEDGYRYYVRTNRGNTPKNGIEFRINVTAKYSPPIITSEPTEMEDGGAADLYCRASGGYPAGTIHWFDQRNTNWTQNSTLQVTQGHDGLFTLSSKLSFKSIDSTWTPFRCVVLNYRYEEEGRSTTALGRKDNTANSNSISSTQVNIIMGTVGVMVFLAALVLVVLLLKRRCLQQNSPRNPDGVEGETALYKVVYKKAADEDPNTSV